MDTIDEFIDLIVDINKLRAGCKEGLLTYDESSSDDAAHGDGRYVGREEAYVACLGTIAEHLTEISRRP